MTIIKRLLIVGLLIGATNNTLMSMQPTQTHVTVNNGQPGNQNNGNNHAPEEQSELDILREELRNLLEDHDLAQDQNVKKNLQTAMRNKAKRIAYLTDNTSFLRKTLKGTAKYTLYALLTAGVLYSGYYYACSNDLIEPISLDDIISKLAHAQDTGLNVLNRLKGFIWKQNYIDQCENLAKNQPYSLENEQYCAQFGEKSLNAYTTMSNTLKQAVEYVRNLGYKCPLEKLSLEELNTMIKNAPMKYIEDAEQLKNLGVRLNYDESLCLSHNQTSTLLENAGNSSLSLLDRVKNAGIKMVETTKDCLTNNDLVQKIDTKVYNDAWNAACARGIKPPQGTSLQALKNLVTEHAQQFPEWEPTPSFLSTIYFWLI